MIIFSDIINEQTLKQWSSKYFKIPFFISIILSTQAIDSAKLKCMEIP